MQIWWTNFAKYHNPNGQDIENGTWPTATSFSEDDTPEVLRISDTLASEEWP
jgi:hypothetical protein